MHGSHWDTLAGRLARKYKPKKCLLTQKVDTECFINATEKIRRTLEKLASPPEADATLCFKITYEDMHEEGQDV